MSISLQQYSTDRLPMSTDKLANWIKNGVLEQIKNDKNISRFALTKQDCVPHVRAFLHTASLTQEEKEGVFLYIQKKYSMWDYWSQQITRLLPWGYLLIALMMVGLFVSMYAMPSLLTHISFLCLLFANSVLLFLPRYLKNMRLVREAILEMLSD